MTALLCLSSLFPFSFMLKHGNRKYLCTFVSMKTFVIAGCGRLAGIVSEAVVKGLLPEYELVGAYSRTVAKAERIAGRMAEAGKSCAVCTTVDELLALKPDILGGNGFSGRSSGSSPFRRLKKRDFYRDPFDRCAGR